MEDFKVKLEMEDAIKLEQLEPDHGEPNNSDQLDYQAWEENIVEGVKSEEMELTETRGELMSNDNSEDLKVLDFERQIPEFYVKQESCEVKLESDEIIIKSETEETDINSQTFSALETLYPELYHKCPHCNFRTANKNNFRTHLRVHLEAMEAEMFFCGSCNFRSRHKAVLGCHVFRKHAVTGHTNDSCNLCSDQIKNGNGSKRQILKCNHCDYQTTKRSNFKQHALVHMADSEVKKFSCSSCDFRTKYKTSLYQHMRLKHGEDPTNHKCHRCSFQTRDRYTLKRHINNHDKLK